MGGNKDNLFARVRFSREAMPYGGHFQLGTLLVDIISFNFWLWCSRPDLIL
jgi:hypothetical protein